MQFKILSIIKRNREDMVLADPPLNQIVMGKPIQKIGFPASSNSSDDLYHGSVHLLIKLVQIGISLDFHGPPMTKNASPYHFSQWIYLRFRVKSNAID